MLQRLKFDAKVIPDLNEAPSDHVKCLAGGQVDPTPRFQQDPCTERRRAHLSDPTSGRLLPISGRPTVSR